MRGQVSRRAVMEAALCPFLHQTQHLGAERPHATTNQLLAALSSPGASVDTFQVQYSLLN